MRIGCHDARQIAVLPLVAARWVMSVIDNRVQIASRSDNLTAMAEVTATEAARSFADLLDAVEHRGERFTIVRRGKAIASLQPASEGHGAEVKEVLRRRQPDGQWMQDLVAVRSVVELQDRT